MFRPEAAWVAALATAWTLTAHAQLVDLDPDWKESAVTLPTTLRTDKLVALEMPRYLTTKFGIDPESIQITPEGVVRYIVVTTSAGGTTVTGSYEGIRCLTGEFRVYARTSSSGTWQALDQSPWRALNTSLPSQHALAMARQGACNGRAAAEPSASAIVTRLKGRAGDPLQR